MNPWVFTNTRTGRRFTSVRGGFAAAVRRAGISTGDVTLHTLRHTALSRMIESEIEDYTVMEISGHSSTRMLARYTHPTDQRKIGALVLPDVVTKWSHRTHGPDEDAEVVQELVKQLPPKGGRFLID